LEIHPSPPTDAAITTPLRKWRRQQQHENNKRTFSLFSKLLDFLGVSFLCRPAGVVRNIMMKRTP
jgi:hypothetical protein